MAGTATCLDRRRWRALPAAWHRAGPRPGQRSPEREGPPARRGQGRGRDGPQPRLHRL